VEAAPGAQTSQKFEITLAPAAQGETGPDDEPAHPEALGERRCEAIRAPGAQLLGERDDHHSLGPACCEQLDAVVETAEQRRAARRIDDAARMRVEGDRDGGHGASGGRCADAPQQTLMADVDAVETADRHHRPWAARLPRGELMEQFHRVVSRPTPWSAGAGR